MTPTCSNCAAAALGTDAASICTECATAAVAGVSVSLPLIAAIATTAAVFVLALRLFPRRPTTSIPTKATALA